MRLKKRTIILGISLLIGLVAFSTTYFFKLNKVAKNHEPLLKEEYQNLANHFTSVLDSSVQIEGVIKLYDGEHPDSLKEESSFCFIRNNKSYYSQMSHQRTFCNGTYMVLIDSLERQIVITRLKDTSVIATSNNPLFNKFINDTSLLSIHGEITSTNYERTMSFFDENVPEVKLYTVNYNPSNYTVNSAKIAWWKNPLNALKEGESDKVWVTNMSYKYINNNHVDIDKMLREVLLFKSDNKIEIHPDYSTYQVHKLF